MKFKKKELLKEHKEVIERIFPLLEKGDFYLAGGTALYYYLKHHYSVDLDFFTRKNIDFYTISTNFFSRRNKKHIKRYHSRKDKYLFFSLSLSPFKALSPFRFHKSGKFGRYPFYENKCHYFLWKLKGFF